MESRDKEYQFERIIEILREYWMDEPDEIYMKCQMEFQRADGAHQEKTIVWRG